MTVMDAVMFFGATDAEAANFVSRDFNEMRDSFPHLKAFGVDSKVFPKLKACCNSDPSAINKTVQLIISGHISLDQFFGNLKSNNPEPFLVEG